MAATICGPAAQLESLANSPLAYPAYLTYLTGDTSTAFWTLYCAIVWCLILPRSDACPG